MRIRVLPQAYSDLVSIREGNVSGSVVERIQTTINKLADFPRIGRPGRLSGTRELVVLRTAYLVVYCVIEDVVAILRVLDARRARSEEE
ncbi:type II toxin-antitoxin system RelE/ParE family toxin [Gloeobacter morelensis]|uniref:Type II toxin-antitoxin system RelE/ParE family toxin n=1 Tax=Gloeobacter morelensis MG652769 TaxID=2781736 RepID=A0ABY3PL85_9CYAN|nr:type II toxin-antitoxin system RelE/ParE family toxin [Gloeobacter morelensis MG652769]